MNLFHFMQTATRKGGGLFCVILAAIAITALPVPAADLLGPNPAGTTITVTGTDSISSDYTNAGTITINNTGWLYNTGVLMTNTDMLRRM